MTTSLATITTVNAGASGNSWNYVWPSSPDQNSLIAEAPSVIDTALPGTAYKTVWLILFAGTNGMNVALGNHSAITEYANFEQYIAARRLAGWNMTHVIVCTMLPRGAGQEATRVAYNALLVQGASRWGYQLARFDLDPTIGQAGQNSNLTYYLDGTHPTNAGQAILANILYLITAPVSTIDICGSRQLRGSLITSNSQ